MDFQVAIGYGKDGKPDFWIADMNAGDASGPNRENHVAFQAADTDAVHAFYDAALETGAEALHAPRLWPEYHPGYFGAFVRDPDGNNVEAVFHGAPPEERPGYRQGMTDTDAAAVRELLRDSFTRLIEHVEELTDGLTDEVAFFRPTGTANSIAWLIWHSARQHDAQLCDIAGIEQVWTRDGWVDRFGLDLPRDAHGYGHTAEEVGKVRASADLLAGYYHAVHKVTLEYIASVTAEELNRVVDTNWNPPVTASVRLVSIIDDSAQHLGQAAYIRGIA